jgi:hypothetical protein
MAGGRHRCGVPYTPVRRRRWDERQRAQAAHLDALEPGWAILYGPWSRVFFAFAAWPAPRALVVGARTPEGLWDAMRQAEMSAAVVRGVA